MWDSLDPYLLLVPQMETLVSVSWCEGSLDEFLPAQKVVNTMECGLKYNIPAIRVSLFGS